MQRRTLGRRWLAAAAAGLIGIAMPALGASPALAQGDAGDDPLVVPINDSEAGGTYDVTFELAFSGMTVDDTPVYIYVPEGALAPDGESVDWMNPAFDPNPNDEFEPCASKFEEGDYLVTQEQVDILGKELVKEGGIVDVDEAHYGPIGLADASDPNSDSLVVLVYNVQDAFYYECDVDVYTAGYFAPEYITSEGLNVIVIDAFDWANRIGEDAEHPQLYEGVIAHELEHLLMNYSDPGELSWVDEGLADFAVFLNGYDIGGSHLTFHQVFHRETSLTRWGGGLENYGASFTFTLYLWERAGGNGDGTFEPDFEYDGAGGDLLIKLIFEEPADGMEGVQNAIETFNATTSGPDLPSAEELFMDWALAIYFDDEETSRFDIHNVNFGDPSFTSWTIEVANDVFFNNRGVYLGATPVAKWLHDPHVPGQTALPFGTSYEVFRKPGKLFDVTFSGEPTTQIAPHTGTEHWYGGYESLSDNILNVDATGVLGGKTIDFWTWYFIEEGWDFGFVEALVGGEWVTVPLFDDAGQEITTDENPHDTNEEGNGLTGTSGGAYFVDEPEYIHLSGTLPAGTTDVQFRYSTDAAYLDTGWFVDDVQIGGTAVTVSSDDWIETTGTQENNWVLQIVSECDLSPGVTSPGESLVEGYYLYRLEGDELELTGLTVQCFRGTRERFLTVISNMPTGDLQYLDAGYEFRVIKQSQAQ